MYTIPSLNITHSKILAGCQCKLRSIMGVQCISCDARSAEYSTYRDEHEKLLDLQRMVRRLRRCRDCADSNSELFEGRVGEEGVGCCGVGIVLSCD